MHMLDNQGFDAWVSEYDKSVADSDRADTYPFAGYTQILETIKRSILTVEQAKVLDLGFGTCTLTKRLYDAGCEISGQDFSAGMVEAGRKKMPQAKLYRGDFSEGIAEDLKLRKYDFIIATYSLHHLSDALKTELLHQLPDLLKENGMILIGDVMFATEEEMEACRRKAGEEWDEEEIYIVVEKFRTAFPDLVFTKVSHCGGILSL